MDVSNGHYVYAEFSCHYFCHSFLEIKKRYLSLKAVKKDSVLLLLKADQTLIVNLFSTVGIRHVLFLHPFSSCFLGLRKGACAPKRKPCSSQLFTSLFSMDNFYLKLYIYVCW